MAEDIWQNHTSRLVPIHFVVAAAIIFTQKCSDKICYRPTQMFIIIITKGLRVHNLNRN